MDNTKLKPPLSVQVGPYVATLRIHLDERGVAWIDDTNVKVAEVVIDHLRGDTPHLIREAHPHLTLARIYAALAYYADHEAEVNAQIKQGQQAYETAYARPENTEWREQMRDRAAAHKAAPKEKVAA